MRMGVEEQAMVIIKTHLTPEAQKVADEEAASRAKEAAKKAKAKKEDARKGAGEAVHKKERKDLAVRIKELGKRMAKSKMPKHDNAITELVDESTKSDNPENRLTDDKAKPDLRKKRMHELQYKPS